MVTKDTANQMSNESFGARQSAKALSRREAIPILLAPLASAQSASTNPQSMINLITWSKDNGYSSIDWKAITEVSIFHMLPDSNGNISYDRKAIDVNEVISKAHKNDVKATFALGGAGLSPAIVNSVLYGSAKDNLISNVVGEIKKRGYDGVQMDFENDKPGDFKESHYNRFMRELSEEVWSADPNYAISLAYATWESKSINPTALEPYINKLLLMFDPPSADISNVASQLNDPSKLSIGYELEKEAPRELLHKLVANVNAGYGIFFWEASKSNKAFYNCMEAALRGQQVK